MSLMVETGEMRQPYQSWFKSADYDFKTGKLEYRVVS